jgi:hypothetical protein
MPRYKERIWKLRPGMDHTFLNLFTENSFRLYIQIVQQIKKWLFISAAWYQALES